MPAPGPQCIFENDQQRHDGDGLNGSLSKAHETWAEGSIFGLEGLCDPGFGPDFLHFQPSLSSVGPQHMQGHHPLLRPSPNNRPPASRAAAGLSGNRPHPESRTGPPGPGRPAPGPRCCRRSARSARAAAQPGHAARSPAGSALPAAPGQRPLGLARGAPSPAGPGPPPAERPVFLSGQAAWCPYDLPCRPWAQGSRCLMPVEQPLDGSAQPAAPGQMTLDGARAALSPEGPGPPPPDMQARGLPVYLGTGVFVTSLFNEPVCAMCV